MSTHDEKSYVNGWRDAIAHMKKHFDMYLKEKQAGNPVDPIEEWFPRFLEEELSEEQELK